ncbi:MAG: glycosyltransferase 87 family protein [Gordonia sp. (in: high G+C Gram-positive bacteria)]
MRLERSTSLLVGFVVLAALAVWVQNAIIPLNEPFWGLFDYQLDLDVYRAGAQTVLDGEPLYRAKLLGQMDFTYAPISIVLFTPFAWMPAGVAHVVWSVLIFVALYFVIVLSFRSLGHDVTWKLRGVAASLVVISTLLEPVRSTIWFGQINIFLMLLILWDLLRPEGSRLRGVGAGVAAGIKLTPLLFVVYLLLVRQWRAAATLVGGFALTVAVGFALMPRDSWTYWTDTLFDPDRVSSPQTAGNQSIRGALANIGHTDKPSSLWWILIVLAVLALCLYAAVLAHRHVHELLSLSLVGMTSCAVSPVAWGHHWVWLVPLLVFAIHLLTTLRSPIAWAEVAELTVAGFLTGFAWRHYLGYPIWYVNRSVEYAYLTGTFFKGNDPSIRWFTVQPYNWILLVTALVTVAVYTVVDRRSAPEARLSDPAGSL